MAAIAAALLSTVTVLVTGPAAPSATAAQCSDVAVVFARGTDEPNGIGRVGQAFTDELQSLIPGHVVSTYAVNYPASYDFLTAQDGAVDATKYLSNLESQCPSTRIVLGGYSQGAAVMDMLIGLPPLGNKLAALGGKFGDVGIAAPLSGAWRTASLPSCSSAIPRPSSATRGHLPIRRSELARSTLQRRRSDLFTRSQPVRAQRLRDLAVHRPSRRVCRGAGRAAICKDGPAITGAAVDGAATDS